MMLKTQWLQADKTYASPTTGYYNDNDNENSNNKSNSSSNNNNDDEGNHRDDDDDDNDDNAEAFLYICQRRVHEETTLTYQEP